MFQPITWLQHSIHKPHATHNPLIRSDEGTLASSISLWWPIQLSNSVDKTKPFLFLIVSERFNWSVATRRFVPQLFVMD